jgi:cobalt/nickel transport system permease protein
MIQESFADGDSPIHRIDPRLRVAGAVSMAIVVAVSYQFLTLAAALVLSLLLVLIAQLDLRIVLRRLLAPALFLLLLWAILPWSFEGDTVATFGPVTLTRPGIVLCSQISLKTVALMAAFMALVATMTVDTLGHSLNRLKLPDNLVYMVLITFRYLFVIEQEYQRLVRAMKIRNFHPKTNLHSYRSVAFLIGMLFVRASDRAHRVHGAMICRGFNGKFVSLREYPPHPGNGLFCLFIGFTLMLLISLEWVILS